MNSGPSVVSIHPVRKVKARRSEMEGDSAADVRDARRSGETAASASLQLDLKDHHGRKRRVCVCVRLPAVLSSLCPGAPVGYAP